MRFRHAPFTSPRTSSSAAAVAPPPLLLLRLALCRTHTYTPPHTHAACHMQVAEFRLAEGESADAARLAARAVAAAEQAASNSRGSTGMPRTVVECWRVGVMGC